MRLRKKKDSHSYERQDKPPDLFPNMVLVEDGKRISIVCCYRSFLFSNRSKREIRSDCASRSAFSVSRRLIASLTREFQTNTDIVTVVTKMKLNVCKG